MMKKSIKTFLLTLCLIIVLILIIVMSFFMYKLYIEKQNADKNIAELNKQISSLNSEISNLENTISTISNIVSKNTIENNNTSSESTNNAFKEIILNGTYAIENSDAGYEFTSSGKVTVISNFETNEGTYITSGENEITIHFTNRTSYDIDTSKEETSSIDEEEILKYVDENTLIITKLSNGKNANTKLIKNK